MAKKETQISKSNFFLVKLSALVVFFAIIWVFLAWFNKTGTPQPKPIIQSVAQLSSATKKYSGMGTATKSHDDTTSQVNVTAFLQKPLKGQNYYVYVKGNGSDLKDMLLGKMTLSGDVFSLNYMASDKSMYAYKNLIVVEETEAQAKASKMTVVVLEGVFSE